MPPERLPCEGEGRHRAGASTTGEVLEMAREPSEPRREKPTQLTPSCQLPDLQDHALLLLKPPSLGDFVKAPLGNEYLGASILML